jgi:hypothetical protein
MRKFFTCIRMVLLLIMVMPTIMFISGCMTKANKVQQTASTVASAAIDISGLQERLTRLEVREAAFALTSEQIIFLKLAARNVALLEQRLVHLNGGAPVTYNVATEDGIIPLFERFAKKALDSAEALDKSRPK